MTASMELDERLHGDRWDAPSSSMYVSIEPDAGVHGGRWSPPSSSMHDAVTLEEPLTPAPPLSSSRWIHGVEDCAAEPTLSRGERVARVVIPLIHHSPARESVGPAPLTRRVLASRPPTNPIF